MNIKKSIHKLRRERAFLEERILRLGPILKGSIISRYVSCGNANCKCSSGKKADLHGPYYYISKKIRGKTKLTYISKTFKNQNKLAENYRKFQSSLREIRSLNRQIEKLFTSLRQKKI